MGRWIFLWDLNLKMNAKWSNMNALELRKLCCQSSETEHSLSNYGNLVDIELYSTI